MLKITIDKDIRCFEAGEVFSFDFAKNNGLQLIVGGNGTGKSTLLQIIRGALFDSKRSMFGDSFKELAQYAAVEHDYEHIFYFDSITDNANHYYNAYDASSFVSSGGIAIKRLSHGQQQLYYTDRLVKSMKAHDRNAKFLLVLDELDKGFSLDMQCSVISFINNLREHFPNLHILFATHNVFLMSEVSELYAMDIRKNIKSDDYLLQYVERILKNINSCQH